MYVASAHKLGEILQAELLVIVTNGITEGMKDAARALIKDTEPYPVS